MKKIAIYFLLILFCSCSYKVHQHKNIYTVSKSGTNFYLIKEHDQFLMVDCGTPNNGDKIKKTLLKNNINPFKIKYLFLTHAHYDHAGNAAYFQENFKTKIIVGKGDLDMIKNHGKDSLLCSTNSIAKIGKLFIKNTKYASFIPDIIITNPFNLNSLNFTGTIIPLAGHTKGSLILKTGATVFVGDLIRGNIFNSSKPERHFYMCNLKDNYMDVKYVSNLPNIKTWYLGHSGSLTNNSILHFLNKN